MGCLFSEILLILVLALVNDPFDQYVLQEIKLNVRVKTIKIKKEFKEKPTI